MEGGRDDDATHLKAGELVVCDSKISVWITKGSDQQSLVYVDVNDGGEGAAAMFTSNQLDAFIDLLAATRKSLAANALAKAAQLPDLPTPIWKFARSERQKAHLYFALPDETIVQMYVRQVRSTTTEAIELHIGDLKIEPHGRGTLGRIVRALDEHLPTRFGAIVFTGVTNKQLVGWLGRQGYQSLGADRFQKVRLETKSEKPTRHVTSIGEIASSRVQPESV